MKMRTDKAYSYIIKEVQLDNLEESLNARKLSISQVESKIF